MSLITRLLRYNGRHHFYWRISDKSGNYGPSWPRLNPISSVYGRGITNISWHEPLRLFRLRQRLFAFAGRHRCGRRNDVFAWNRGDGDTPDTWDIGPDGNRTCSYCGSIHPEDLMAICRKALTDDRYAIEGTTKSYKVYVRQPGVRNAGDGAIKFYLHHAPKAPTAADQQLFHDAVRISNERFRTEMAAWRAERTAPHA